MYVLPADICRLCRNATSEDICSWSFGAIVKESQDEPVTWPTAKGTLDDEGIFGPIVDFECSCRKYVGPQYIDHVCDICGVKIASRHDRRTRFGHINLSVPITHDVCGGTERIDAFPVLPARLTESAGGSGLNSLYEKMLRGSNNLNAISVREAYHEICALVGPIVTVAVEWMLQEAPVLARGLGHVLVSGDQ